MAPNPLFFGASSFFGVWHFLMTIVYFVIIFGFFVLVIGCICYSSFKNIANLPKVRRAAKDRADRKAAQNINALNALSNNIGVGT